MSKKPESGISRRGFLKWGTAAAALSTGLTACGSDSDDAMIAGGGGSITDDPETLLRGGEWVTAACPTCSGFRCVNRVYIKDGIPVRQKTDDQGGAHTLETPQHRACVKGRDMRFQVFNPNRVKYPMKRKSWNPGEGTDKATAKRGMDEWERISWDDALNIVHSEITRIGDRFPKGSFHGVDGMGRNMQNTLEPNYAKGLNILNLGTSDEPVFLNVAGYGSLPTWGESSQGAFPLVHNIMGEMSDGAYDRFTSLDTLKLLVLWGNNPVWSSYSNQHYFFKALKDKGVKIVAVDPWFNPGNNAFVDYWVPCRPGTDAALILGLCHELISNESNGWIDRQFINDNTVGFDEAHMPIYLAGTTNPIPNVTESDGQGGYRHKGRKNCFRNYVMGQSDIDSVEKTAAWASSICGAPEALIKQLAEDLGTIKPAWIANANAPARTYNGGSFAQGLTTLKWITGNVASFNISSAGSYTATVGYSNYLSTDYFRVAYPLNSWDPSGTPSPRVQATVNVDFTTAWKAELGNPKASYPYGERNTPWALDNGSYQPDRYYGVAYADVWNAVIDGKHKNFTNNIWSDDRDPVTGIGWKNQEIHAMVKLHGSNPLNQFVNARRGIEAFRDPKVEFIFVQDITFGASAQYADIVVPFTSLWELDGQISYQNNDMFIGNAERVIPPLFEAKPSKWTDGMLCKMFGGSYEDGDPVPQQQASFDYVANTFVNTFVKNNDGNYTYEPLIKFTPADLDHFQNDLGVNITVTGSFTLADGRFPYQQFKEQGYIKFNFNKDKSTVNVAPTGLAQATTKFAQDTTETGKGEIYCQPLSDYYDKFGFSKIDPICTYRGDAPRGYDEAAADPEFKLQMINVIALARVLGRPGSPNLKEVFGDGFYINPIDAKKYGDIKSGDTVLVTSKTIGSDGKHGRALMRAIVTHTIMPGVVMSPCGAAIDTIEVTIDGEKEVIDRGGNSNFLSEGILCGGGHEAFNTCIVKVEKWTGDPLPAEYSVNYMADKLKNVF